MSTATKAKTAPKAKAKTKATTKAVKPPVVVEQASEPIKIENTNGTSPRMVAIHHMWDLLQASPITVEQLAQKVAGLLIKTNRMEAEAAAKLASQAINHQLPYETGQKGRKTIRVRQSKNKLEWIGGAVRRRNAS